MALIADVEKPECDLSDGSDSSKFMCFQRDLAAAHRKLLFFTAVMDDLQIPQTHFKV